MDFIPYISFLTGFISIISPCIIPVLPILFGFTLKNKGNKEIIAFVIGLFSVFTTLIFIAGLFTVMFYSYVFYLRIFAAIVLLIVGFLFVFNKSFNLSFKNMSSDGILGSFALGILTSIAWAPCYGGYLISLVSVLITTANFLYISFNIILYGLGFGVSLLILSFIISKINLENFIEGSEHIRKISGILFIVGAAYMFLTANGVIL
ncbi:MAG: cytochrome c biogenesis protein CcdA [Methanobrevibacter sp.]|uniref:cytochrome c biogenesis CcdA family protein n=1 Tax=Methanobrevibacter sp. TaxID=66852 RepID=UPI0026DF2842|nr:cytochrome c biogenesis protein CcdA [Methanobrevibacter sp.]MDO5848380.1 cytochrome c biogenesis protein CcdA [Methanobrevibacter sp.]